MILIIDAYNLMFHERWPEQRGTLETKRNQLLEIVGNYHKQAQIGRTIVVFDGCAGIGPYKKSLFKKNIEVIYAVCQGKADEEIIALSKRLNGVSVVTADRRIAQKVKRHKSSVIDPEDFIRSLYQQTNQETSTTLPLPNNQEIDEWLTAFHMDEEIEISPYPKNKLPKIPKKPPSNKKKPDGKEPPLGDLSVKEWMNWFEFTSEEINEE